VAAKTVPGRPSKLTARQKKSLLTLLSSGPQACGFATDLWTCRRIAKVVRRRFGVRYHVDYVPRLLASLGLSCQKPERQAAERDERAIQRWLERDWPRIKKSRTAAGTPGFHR
jgi:transposase